MTPKEFVKEYYPFAVDSGRKSGISAIFTLAQAAIESGWGKAAPGNNFFGLKDRDSVNGNEQLLVTTEYSRRNDLQFPEILSIKPVILNGQKYFKYRVKDYFRLYETPGDCFDDHALFFFKNPRYRLALGVSYNPVLMAIQVAKAGYATNPGYEYLLLKVIGMIQKEVDQIDKKTWQ